MRKRIFILALTLLLGSFTWNSALAKTLKIGMMGL